MEYTQEERQERIITVAVAVGDNEDVENSLAELGELAKTAGALCVGTVIQNREHPHPGTYLGKGKI